MNQADTGIRPAVATPITRRWLAVLLLLPALMVLLPPAWGQTATPATAPVAQVAPPTRWLLIFDTSDLMKKRIPAVSNEVVKLFVTDMGDRLRSGDSVGVWTFATELHPGAYPLFTWDPAGAMAAATNLMKFVSKQSYKGQTDFDALQPLLGQVIQHSERLTVVIFCDGEGQIDGTPYDEGINENLQAGMAERKKHRQPVVVLLRTQRGKFVGANVNYPPTELTMPMFPPLSAPEKPAAAPVPPVPPPPPVAELPSLILTGKPPVTNMPVPVPVVSNTPAISNTPSQAAVTVITNPVATVSNAVAVALPESETNQAPPPPTPTPTVVTNLAIAWAGTNPVPTNAVADTVVAQPADRGTVILLSVGGGLLLAAVILVIVLLLLRRRQPASLITRVMSEDPRFRK